MCNHKDSNWYYWCETSHIFETAHQFFGGKVCFWQFIESNSDGSVLDECSRKSKHLPASCKFGRNSISSPKMLQLFAKACQTHIFVSDCVAEVSRRKSCKDWSTERSRLDKTHFPKTLMALNGRRDSIPSQVYRSTSYILQAPIKLAGLSFTSTNLDWKEKNRKCRAVRKVCFL